MKRPLLAIAAGVVLGVAGLLAADQQMTVQQPPHAMANFDRVPNVTLTTHEGKPVEFYEDLIKGKQVAINFFYIDCDGF